jgi:hypothetical protein
VREQHRCDVEVILDQVALCDVQFRPEGFVEVRELHDSIVNLDVESVLVLRQFDLWD